MRNVIAAAIVTLGTVVAFPRSPVQAREASPKETARAPTQDAAPAVTANPLPRVRLDGTYFTREGRRFIPVGAHWVPAKAAMQWPARWDPSDIEADFAKMRDLGYNLVRLDLVWAWFEPRPGDYREEAFRQLDVLVSMAHKYRIYLHPSLFIGGEVGEAYWDVPWRHGRHPHADPEMLRLETNLAEEFGRRYGEESAIIAWDLTDEPPFWIVADRTTDAMAVDWTRLIAGGIRRHDRMHPIVVGTSGQETGHGPFRADLIADAVDFFSVHPFTLYNPDLFPDALLSARGTYGAAFEVALSRGAGRPAMIQEMGASTAQFSPERVAAYVRAQAYSGLGAGTIGLDLWCYTDAAPEQFRRAPYVRTPQETGWGMTTWDRRDKPLAREFRKLARIFGRLDLTGLAPAPPDMAIIVPDEWAKPHGDFSGLGLEGPEAAPYVSTADGDAMPGAPLPDTTDANRRLMGSALTSFILGRRAGLRADFPRERSDWSTLPMVFLPSPLTGTDVPFLAHVRTDFYEKARKYVENGGALYASLAADSAIPGMESLFGARTADRAVGSEVTLKFVRAFGDFEPGRTMTYRLPSGSTSSWGMLLEATTGEVIAVDPDGRPALVTNRVGSGKTLVCAYPIERCVAETLSAFDGPEETHRLYAAFRDWAGVKPAFRGDNPAVEISALSGAARGYVVAVNHSPEAQTVTIRAASPVRSASRVDADGPVPLPVRDSGWTLDIGPFDAVIVEWNR